MKLIALPVLAVLLSPAALAQDSRLGGEFALWAEKAWAEAAGHRSLQVSKRLNPFVWRGDDFSWMDVWNVQDKGAGHGKYRGQSVTLPADGLLVAKESSASALIYFRNGRPIWQQLGD